MYGLVEIQDGLLSVVILLSILVVVGKIIKSHQQGDVALRTTETAHSWQKHGGIVDIAGLDERYMSPEELPVVIGTGTEEGKGALVGKHRGKQQMIVELDVVIIRHHACQLLQTVELAFQNVGMVGLDGIEDLGQNLLCQEFVALAALQDMDVLTYLIYDLVGS